MRSDRHCVVPAKQGPIRRGSRGGWKLRRRSSLRQQRLWLMGPSLSQGRRMLLADHQPRLVHPIPPRACPRHQPVIAVHDLDRRATAGCGGAHSHLARDFAIGRRQPHAFMAPQARAVQQLGRLPVRGLDFAAAPAAFDHERRRRLGVERRHEIVGMTAERDADAIRLGQRDIVGLADIVERKQSPPSDDACRCGRSRSARGCDAAH